ncbi:MAG TPA: hypothetical protein PLV68_19120, partial [Ilumatobacteraceae bacterium]|nr:hypothetical protein [Ilumatobacteraceae bacterium]
MPAGLSYGPVSFNAQLTTWDANGLNQTTSAFSGFTPAFSGNGFTSTVDLPEKSVLTITYTASVQDPEPLRALLQAVHNARNGEPGNFEINLVNTATFGGNVDRTATVRMRGSIPAAPGPNIGNAFSKTSDWSSRNVVTDEDDNLVPPQDITYTLKVDLGQWDNSGGNFSLARNVVISDDLPAGASWNTSDLEFIKIASGSGITLSLLTACPADQVAMESQPVGSYCVNGQRLLINVGQNSATNLTIAVKAKVNSLDGLTANQGTTPIVGATPYRLRNDALYYYRAGDPYTARRDVTVVNELVTAHKKAR